MLVPNPACAHAARAETRWQFETQYVKQKKKKTPPFIKRLEIASLCLGFQEGIYQELARESSALSVVSWRCPTADMQMPHRRQ